MNLRYLFLALILLLVISNPASANGTRLLRQPSVSRDLVAFEYASDIWVVARNGGQARRLTATPGVETEPQFSPDGSRIAFTATVAGNTDVYVVPTTGGDPKRLTYHPALDAVRGWTPDGRRVIFASDRDTAPHAHFRLWMIETSSGMPEPLPMPRVHRRLLIRRAASRLRGVLGGDVPPWAQNQASQWRHHRGGRTHLIRIMKVSDYSVEQLPWSNSNDTTPMWIGNTVYFLSDRNHTVNLFSHRVDTKALTQLTRHEDFDIMRRLGGSDASSITGWLHSPCRCQDWSVAPLAIEVAGDFPWARPQFKKSPG
jgi:tricorn protease